MSVIFCTYNFCFRHKEEDDVDGSTPATTSYLTGQYDKDKYDTISLPDLYVPPSPADSDNEWLWELETPLGQSEGYFDADNLGYYEW